MPDQMPHSVKNESGVVEPAVASRALLAGVLLTLGYAVAPLGPNGWVAWTALASGLLCSAAAFFVPTHPRWARRLAILSVLAGLAICGPRLIASPALALAVLIGVFAIAIGFVRQTQVGRICLWHILADSSFARGAAIGAVTTLIVAGLSRRPQGILAGFVAASLSVLATLFWAVRGGRRDLLHRATVACLALVAAAGAYWLLPHSVASLSVLAAGLIVVALSVRNTSNSEPPLLQLIAEHPARLTVSTFAVLCTIGTVLLALPTSAARAAVSLIDSAFTAVSAVCVTGLVVVDTPTTFSFSGQVWLVLLIQLGGLGIMALYTTAFGLLGHRLSLRHEQAVASVQSIESSERIFRSLAALVGATLAFEAAGALLLFIRFVEHEPVGAAAWRAVFHAISAFCNAGFALQSDNLMGYARDPVVLHTIAALIVLGGLSPATIGSLPSFIRGKRILLHARVALTTTLVLLAVGFVCFLAFEWNGTLSGFGWAGKLNNAWLQSVSPRTAGFNSIDFAKISTPTRLLMMGLMFVGGCPGGTAGGIKTTTLALLLLAVSAALRGRTHVVAFGCRVPMATIGKATAIVTVGLGSVLAATLALLLTQALKFDEALFEAISALATVGLSLGATSRLDEVGKIIIMVSMFAGRVGPLTLLLILSEREQVDVRTLPEQDVQVG